MLWTICVILFILWLLGFIGGYTGGGLIHILLVVAIIVVVIQVYSGTKMIIAIRTRKPHRKEKSKKNVEAREKKECRGLALHRFNDAKDAKKRREEKNAIQCKRS